MSDEARVLAAVARYCEKYAISPQFGSSDVVEINQFRQKKRNAPWPHGDDAGCYVMYNPEMKLLYIGLAGHIAGRLNSWFRYNEREDAELSWTSRAEGNWGEQPKYLQTIRANISYEAPSLEAFLIGVLSPPENINLKNVPELSKFVEESAKR
jgi:excinuclease UvrABC nuclease subunit